MSILSALETKIVAARLSGYGFFALFIGGLFIPKGEVTQSLTQSLTWVAFLGVAGTHWYINKKAVCPRCKVKLPQARFAPGLRKDLHACPACQLNLDLEQVPEALKQ